MAVIRIESASKILKGNMIFQDINMLVEKGCCYGIIGADNEGKSSLLYTIIGQNTLTNGTISLFDDIHVNKKTAAEIAKRMGYVPDDLLCMENMTGAQLLDMTIHFRNLEDRVDYAQDLIEFFEVDPSLQLTDMSADMNKCIYIISAILGEPELLILDEPFNFLSEKNSERFADWMKAYTADGNTILITGNEFQRYAQLCDTISVLQNRKQTVIDMDVELLRPMKLIKAANVIWSSVPEDITVVGVQRNVSLMLFSGELQRLREIIVGLKCDDISINDISIEDQLFQRYDWLEEIQ